MMTPEFQMVWDTYGTVILMIGGVAVIGAVVLKLMLGDVFKL